MLGRLPATARVGIAFIVIPLAVFGTWYWWYFSRSWEPVNAAPSFSSPHTMSVAFDINVEGYYSIVIQTFRNPCRGDAGPCDVGLAGVDLKWALTREGKKLAEGRLEGNRNQTWWRELGGFHGTSGHYQLSLELLDDASILGFRESSLRVFENGDKQELYSDLGGFSLLACFLCVPVGICLVIQSAILRRQERYGILLRSHISHAMGPGLKGSGIQVSRAPFVSRRKRVRPVAPLSPMRPSTHSLILTIASSTLWSILCVAQALDHRVSSGLRVRILRPGIVTMRSPGLQPLLVRIAANGLFVDSQSISRRDLGPVLRRELDRRPPDWPVYFKGDSKKGFQYSSDVIEAIREQGAEVILLTRKSWSER
jgi:hypothetical protein